jgi:hypothetical protein
MINDDVPVVNPEFIIRWYHNIYLTLSLETSENNEIYGSELNKIVSNLQK